MTNITGEFAIVAFSQGCIQPSFTSTQSLRPSGVPAGQPRTMLTAEPPLRFDLHFADGERIKVELTGSGYEPSSLWRVLESIQNLTRLPRGWDSYGSQPLDARAVRRSFGLLPLLLKDETPEPNAIPTRDGGLQFEWHRRGIDLEVTVRPSGPVSYYFADAGTGEEQEWNGNLGRQAIAPILARISQVG